MYDDVILEDARRRVEAYVTQLGAAVAALPPGRRWQYALSAGVVSAAEVELARQAAGHEWMREE